MLTHRKKTSTVGILQGVVIILDFIVIFLTMVKYD